MAVAQRTDRDPGEEVEVLLAVGVVEVDPLPPHEVDRPTFIGAHQVALLERPGLAEAHHGITIVPIPASVKSSRSRLWGTRPSMMWADWAPPLTASTQAASFGRMPPERPGSASSTSLTAAREIKESSSSASARQPSTSVRKIALVAPSAAATLPAASSALTL